MKKFILLCTARTGSNYIMNLLSGHDNVKVLGEIFNLDSLPEQTMLEALRNPIEYFNNKFDCHKAPDTRAVGAKIFYDHFTPDYFRKFIDIEDVHPTLKQLIVKLQNYMDKNVDKEDLENKFREMWDYMEADRSLHVIHLKRKNMLETFVSLKRAFVTGEWVKLGKKTAPDNFSITIDFDECLRFFEQVNQYQERCDMLFSDHNKLDITYEAIVENRTSVIHDITEFLSLPPYEPFSVMKKQIEIPLDATVRNYSELKGRFQNTSWDVFFT